MMTMFRTVKKKTYLFLCVCGLIYIALQTSYLLYTDPERKQTEDSFSNSAADFQKVADDDTMFVYSAFYEARTDTLRILGVTNKKNMSVIFCHLHDSKERNSVVIKGYIHHIPESHNLPYTATFYICKLKGIPVSDMVSVIGNPFAEKQFNVLQIIKVTDKPGRKRNFTLCVSPLHSRFSDTSQLIEWLELSKILGANHVMFYIKSASRRVIDVLNYYKSQGFVSIFSWSLTESVMTNLHYYGQVLAINDFLYRNKFESKYISTYDLDEIVIPQTKNHLTWAQMMNTLSSEIRTSESVFIFRSALFSQRAGCAGNSACRGRLTVDSYLFMKKPVLPSHTKSKYFVKPDKVEMLHIHFATDQSTGRYYTVPKGIGLLHHYRRQKIGLKGLKRGNVRHDVAKKYITLLNERIKMVKRNFKKYLEMTL